MEYVAKMASLFRTYYSSISASDEKSDLCYDAKSLSQDLNSTEIELQFRQKLSDFRKMERERCTTMVGPHRDDLGFYLNDRPIALHGSQGQQKSFVLALKMAEIEYLKSIRGEYPVLLLDDMTAELDRNRTAHLVEFMLSREMQVIITTTDPADARLPEAAISSVFHVENGKMNSR
jgi:DNA replication and repair protein RecF